jgi:TET-Associated Glycosyltransferase
VNPKHPVYIVSKGRWEKRQTSRTLERLGVPYRIVIEQQEFDNYAAVIDPQKILILDKFYQANYDTCDNLGDTKSKGPGPARNFVWDHAIKSGAACHWVMDDNIRGFVRLIDNMKRNAGDGTVLRCMEDFIERYENVVMAGPAYEYMTPRKSQCPPFIVNTRIYSCNLIRNDIPYRWRGRYNEDTDLSLRILKDGWCTIQFNAFLQFKAPTQTHTGGCNTDFYSKEGTLPKSQMQVKLHPDVSRLTFKFGRWHHHVDYRPFRGNRLKLKPGITIPDQPDDYGMKLIHL